MTFKVGLISDTHTTDGAALVQLVQPHFAGVERILHAGDIVAPEVLQALSRIAPVEAVYGNMDPIAMHRVLPARRLVTLGRFRVGLIHGGGAPDGIERRVLAAFADEPVDAIVFGHTHTPLVKRVNGVLLVNPGSATDSRWTPVRTVAFLEIGSTLEAYHVELDR
ncbi:MAG: metallophosphoesterase family protein [Bradymonadales bacterium]|nr:metallophosphoesterase family protein [Bradymonadales bacterium]